MRKILSPKIKKKVNKALNSLTINKHFDSIPLNDIKRILEQADIILLQEDGTPWSGFLLGDNATASIVVGDKNDVVKSYGDSIIAVYRPFTNTSLQLSWYRMPSGKFEVSVYLS